MTHVRNNIKIKINKEVIKALNPCIGRYKNYLKHHENFKGNLEEFFELKEINHQGKLWVALRVLPRETVEIFAIDCALSAINHANAANADAAAYVAAAANAADAAAYVAAAANAANAAAVDNVAYAAANVADAAADAAAYAAYAADAERERQLEALIYLAGKI